MPFIKTENTERGQGRSSVGFYTGHRRGPPATSSMGMAANEIEKLGVDVQGK